MKHSIIQKTTAALLAIGMMLSSSGCGVPEPGEINSANAGHPTDAAIHTSNHSMADSSVTKASITKTDTPDTNTPEIGTLETDTPNSDTPDSDTETDTAAENPAIENPNDHSVKKDVQDSHINKLKAKYQTFCEKTLYPFLLRQWGENPELPAPVYSPVSLYLHLSILSELSDGETQEEILSLLGKKNISTDLIEYAASEHCTLANSMWFDDTTLYNEDLLSETAKTYNTDIFNGPMGKASYNKQINTWLTKQLGSKSREALPEGIKTSKDTLMLLLSTINLEDQWENPFDKELTTKEDFYGQNFYTCGNTTEEEKIDKVSCLFLHGTYFESAMENNAFQAIRLPMKEHSLIIVLPKEDVSVKAILEKHKGTDLLSLCDPDYKKWELQEVDFSMPKLNFKSDYDLIPLLDALGVQKAFNIGTADFTPLVLPCRDQYYNLKAGVYNMPFKDFASPYVDKMHQASTITIDESGCRITSIAETGMKEGCPLPEKKMAMHCNRPFFYMVTNSENLPLFMGTVNRIEKE